MKTVVFRIEISTLLNQDGKINPKKLDRLAMTLTNLHNSGQQVLIVSSGAIVLGTDKLNLNRIPDGQTDMQAVAAVGQVELIRWYQRFFGNYNQIVAQVLLTSDIISYPERINNTRNTFNTLLGMNIIPIINENDPVSAADIEIDDNYPLALVVAGIAKADIIVIKMGMNGNYLIVSRGNKQGIIVNNDNELLAELQSDTNILFNQKSDNALFPSAIGEIIF